MGKKNYNVPSVLGCKITQYCQGWSFSKIEGRPSFLELQALSTGPERARLLKLIILAVFYLDKKWPESAKYDHGRCSDKGSPLPIPSHIIISTETRVHTAMYILHIKSCGRESIKHMVLNSQGMIKTIGTLDTEFKIQDIRRRAREWDASYNSCYSTRSAINLATGFSQKRS